MAKSTASKPSKAATRPVIAKDEKAMADDKKVAAASVSKGKKRKSTGDSSSVKDPEHDPETVKNTEVNAKSVNGSSTAPPPVPAKTRSETEKPAKKSKVHVSKPAVTEAAKQDEIPLPSPAKPQSKKTKSSSKATSEHVVAPSAEKPADGLKSALKKGPSSKKATKSQDVEMAAPAADDDFIHGFSSSEDGQDSSDEDDSDVEMEGAQGKGTKPVLAKDLPNIVKDDPKVEDKLTKAKRKAVSTFLCVSGFWTPPTQIEPLRARKRVFSTSVEYPTVSMKTR